MIIEILPTPWIKAYGFFKKKERNKTLYGYEDVPTIALRGRNSETKEWEVLMEDADYMRSFAANVSSQENKTNYVLTLVAIDIKNLDDIEYGLRNHHWGSFQVIFFDLWCNADTGKDEERTRFGVLTDNLTISYSVNAMGKPTNFIFALN